MTTSERLRAMVDGGVAITGEDLIEAAYELDELKLRIDMALGCLVDAGQGKKYDPSWIRPKTMTTRQIQDSCIQAYHILGRPMPTNLTPSV